jgi:hypothetical protein
MENSVTIKFDDKILLSSGTFQTFGDGVTEMSIEYKKDTMYLNFKFEDNEGESKATTKAEKLGEEKGLIRFINFNSTLGAFNSEPLVLGYISDHKVWLLYEIRNLTNTDRKQFTYSIYISSEPKN